MTPQERRETEKRIKRYLKENKIRKVLIMQEEGSSDDGGITANVGTSKPKRAPGG